METIVKVKSKAWHELILEIDHKGRFDWDVRKSVRGAISDKILNEYPNDKFKTQKIEVEENGIMVKYLEVERIES